MLQLQNPRSIAQALKVMVQASSIGTADADALSAFIQSVQKDDDAGDDVGSPSASAYETHSGSIIDTLEDLAEKAQDQLANVRTKETRAKADYERMKQSIEFEIK